MFAPLDSSLQTVTAVLDFLSVSADSSSNRDVAGKALEDNTFSADGYLISFWYGHSGFPGGCFMAPYTTSRTLTETGSSLSAVPWLAFTTIICESPSKICSKDFSGRYKSWPSSKKYETASICSFVTLDFGKGKGCLKDDLNATFCTTFCF